MRRLHVRLDSRLKAPPAAQLATQYPSPQAPKHLYEVSLAAFAQFVAAVSIGLHRVDLGIAHNANMACFISNTERTDGLAPPRVGDQLDTRRYLPNIACTAL